MVELLEAAVAEYDLVIVDAPPLLGFAEPLQMATAVDGVVIVARAGRTSLKAVATVLATLNRLRAKVVGLVLNEVHKELSERYYYYGYYGSYYQAKDEPKHQEAYAHERSIRTEQSPRPRHSWEFMMDTTQQLP